MNFLVFFLLFSFLAGGAAWGQPLLRRPVVYLAICVVVAASYYSVRVVQ